MIQTALAALTPGPILDNIPTLMHVGQPETIEVRISDNPHATLIDNLAGSGQPATTTIPVSTYMVVQLTGNEDTFKISRQHRNDTQMVIGTTEWSWIVTPLKSGTQTLRLEVSAKILVGIEEQEKSISVLKKTVTVKTDTEETISWFIGTYWQWIASTIVIPVTLWLANRYLLKEKNQKQGKTNIHKRKQSPPRR